MSSANCRWGILSTAAIATKNWHSIAASGNGRVVAVASRSATKAQAFIDACQASVPVAHEVEALGSYDELLSRDDIDAVYIPLPTGLRKDWVIKAAAAGKHVMVEKPCATNHADLTEMVDACRSNNVQFMDGVMFMHSDRLPAIRERLDDGTTVGTLRRIATQFSFCADEEWVASNIRASSELEPAGCLGDLGWYTTRITLFAMKYELPVRVRGQILHGAKRPDSPLEVPMEFQGELHFADGQTATFYNSFRGNHQQWVHLSGTAGYIEWKDFVLPYYGNTVTFETGNHDFAVDGCDFNMERHREVVELPEYSNNHATAQETKLFRNFSQLVLDGRIDDFWPDVALKTQLVLDAVLQSARNNGDWVQLAD